MWIERASRRSEWGIRPLGIGCFRADKGRSTGHPRCLPGIRVARPCSSMRPHLEPGVVLKPYGPSIG